MPRVKKTPPKPAAASAARRQIEKRSLPSADERPTRPPAPSWQPYEAVARAAIDRDQLRACFSQDCRVRVNGQAGKFRGINYDNVDPAAAHPNGWQHVSIRLEYDEAPGEAEAFKKRNPHHKKDYADLSAAEKEEWLGATLSGKATLMRTEIASADLLPPLFERFARR